MYPLTSSLLAQAKGVPALLRELASAHLLGAPFLQGNLK